MAVLGKKAADAFPGLDEFLCFSIYSTGHAFNQIYRPLLDKLELTYPQYLVMVSLWGGDGQTVKELGAQLSLDSSTLTPLLKRLEARGYLSRRRDTQDERQVRLVLTPEGQALQQRAREIPACVAREIGLKKEDYHTLQRLLGEVRERLTKSAE
ncbi:MarR family winged helix-turn-helix transcriptional regulator [Mesorhizobium denitrificans]|uniref:MarR family transcriptional regulator n=1 Tax=Mesorhizobium denitrificans TaxID=2294114 RepID=A0A371XG28_9HYPH|nr:MarR family transcriptional regulator [Mesorhizobium denitrificans]